MRPGIVVRPLKVRALAAFIGGFLTFVAVGIAGGAGGGVFFLLGLPLVAFAAVRGFRIALVADQAEVTLRNYFRTHRLRWADIEEIGLGMHQMGGLVSGAIYFKRRGKRLLVTAQATMLSSVDRPQVLRDLSELRPEVRVRHAAKPT